MIAWRSVQACRVLTDWILSRVEPHSVSSSEALRLRFRTPYRETTDPMGGAGSDVRGRLRLELQAQRTTPMVRGHLPRTSKRFWQR